MYDKYQFKETKNDQKIYENSDIANLQDERISKKVQFWAIENAQYKRISDKGLFVETVNAWDRQIMSNKGQFGSIANSKDQQIMSDRGRFGFIDNTQYSKIMSIKGHSKHLINTWLSKAFFRF